MTLLEIKNQLVAHFLSNSIFTQGDFENILFPPDFSKDKYQVIRMGLSLLEKEGFITSNELKDM